jgi:hypothetical protein
MENQTLAMGAHDTAQVNFERLPSRHFRTMLRSPQPSPKKNGAGQYPLFHSPSLQNRAAKIPTCPIPDRPDC